MYQHKPTREEVLEAVDKRSVYESLKGLTGAVDMSGKYQGLTSSDVAEAIYTNHHGNLINRQYESRVSVLRRGVSVSTVKAHLESLAEAGEIFAVKGDHWSMRGKYGVSSKSTLYMGKEAADRALRQAQQEASERREKAAQQEAERRVLARHADEVKAEWEILLMEKIASGEQKFLFGSQETETAMVRSGEEI